jgi:peroxiredoxin
LEDKNLISYDNALSILLNKYVGKVIKIVNDEFEVDEWQLVKKIEHSVCFKINFTDYEFTNKQAVEINQGKDGLVG